MQQFSLFLNQIDSVVGHEWQHCLYTQRTIWSQKHRQNAHIYTGNNNKNNYTHYTYLFATFANILCFFAFLNLAARYRPPYTHSVWRALRARSYRIVRCHQNNVTQLPVIAAAAATSVISPNKKKKNYHKAARTREKKLILWKQTVSVVGATTC